MKVIESLLLLSLALSGALMAHAVLGRVVKALLWAWSPLASGEAEACTYQRSVYATAEPALLGVVCLAAGAGLAWGLGLLWHSALSPWLMLLGVIGVLTALGLDLHRWERVAVSGNSVWFQRGLGHTVHQVAIDNIREVAVQESAECGFTLRRGRNNRSARLSLRIADRRMVLLPKTDIGGIEAIEGMANFLRLRLQQLREAALEKAQKGQAVKPSMRQRDISRLSVPQRRASSLVTPTPIGADPRPSSRRSGKNGHGSGEHKVSTGPITLSGPLSFDEDELQRALRRLRRQNAARRAERSPQAAAAAMPLQSEHQR